LAYQSHRNLSYLAETLTYWKDKLKHKIARRAKWGLATIVAENEMRSMKPGYTIISRYKADRIPLMNIVSVAMVISLFFGQMGCVQNSKMEKAAIPELRKAGRVNQLYVEDKPFLALGGELGNSTASDLNVLEKALAKCERMHLNTVMLPVYWDLIEPEEGKFDFTLVRGAIDRARTHHIRLVYLWFGTWKNSMSCYVPGWVKRDSARFERVKTSTGETEEIISPESAAANEADARAFSALMRWTKDYDSTKSTVIMVQVENEVGMIPDARDHSEKSEQSYQEKVPDALMSLAARGELGPEVGEGGAQKQRNMERGFRKRRRG
jgi:Beta-galactosidase